VGQPPVECVEELCPPTQRTIRQQRFLEGCDFDRARSLIRKIEGVETFDELYGILWFRYVLDPAGLIECLPRETFRLVISAGVLEHMPAPTSSAIRVQHSKSQWKRWFENDVRYFNRIQRRDWLRMFANAGFTAFEEGGSRADVTGLRIDPQYHGLSREDIECTTLVLVVRRI